jgi:hypothetical protein
MIASQNQMKINNLFAPDESTNINNKDLKQQSVANDTNLIYSDEKFVATKVIKK